MAKKSKNKKNTITERMSFAEILQKYPDTAEIFSKHNMHCFGCPMAMQENLETGIKAHGLDVKTIIKELNESISKRRKRKRE